MLIDYHIHSTFSRDSSMTLREVCERACQLGIKEIAVTEHMDFDPRDYSYGYFDYEAYSKEIELEQEKYAGRLIIKKGVEVDYQQRNEKKIGKWLESHSFDYVLGSVHYVIDTNLSEIEPVRRLFSQHSRMEIYKEYFKEVQAAVLSGMFNAIGHMDLVKRQGSVYMGPLLLEDIKEEVIEVLEAMIKTGVVPEVNTSGWRQPPREPFPGPDTLKLYHDLGGEFVTIGSDSHQLRQLGFNLDEARELLRGIGFQSLATFDKGRLVPVEL